MTLAGRHFAHWANIFGLFVVGPVPVIQLALHMLATMTCCQHLQPLPKISPTIDCYLGNYDFNICIYASIFLDHVSNIGILFKVLLFYLNHTHTHTHTQFVVI